MAQKEQKTVEQVANETAQNRIRDYSEFTKAEVKSLTNLVLSAVLAGKGEPSLEQKEIAKFTGEMLTSEIFRSMDYWLKSLNNALISKKDDTQVQK